MREAFSRLGATSLELRHKHLPFFLYPDMPAARDDDYHLPLRWGERLAAIGYPREPLAALGRSVGLELNFDAEGSSTLDSHRLLLFAEEHDKAGELREALGQRYFVRGERLADREVLLDAADSVGLRGASEVLAEPAAYQEGVVEAVRAARAQGLHSIPVFHFRSGGFETTLHGSSSVEEFHSTFLAIEAHWAER